jgi:flagellar L-ring protein precursor FlgH
MKHWAPLLLLLAGLLVLSSARADSIWQRRTPQAAFLFVDTRARLPGDLLTIVISETTGVDNKDKRDMNKDTNAGATFNFAGKTSAGTLTTRSGTVDLNTQGTSTRGFSSQSAYSVAQNFLDHMTVTVVGVYPNGNLAIEGVRQRLVSREMRTLHLTGVVRPIDIAADNTIQSQSIANLQISYGGEGPESHFTNQGWFGRIVNYVWPF